MSTLKSKKRQHQSKLTGFIVKKFKIDTTDQVNTSNENETTSSDNATQPDNESDEPSIKTSEIPQDLSALGKPRRVPSKNYVFPEKMMDKMRSFSHHWLDQFDWLEYSESNDSTYCKYCRNFSNSQSPFSTSGFSNWARNSVVFNKHTKSFYHKTAKEKHDSFMMTQRVTSGTVIDQLIDPDTIYSQRLVSDDEHFDLVIP